MMGSCHCFHRVAVTLPKAILLDRCIFNVCQDGVTPQPSGGTSRVRKGTLPNLLGAMRWDNAPLWQCSIPAFVSMHLLSVATFKGHSLNTHCPQPLKTAHCSFKILGSVRVWVGQGQPLCTTACRDLCSARCKRT